MEDTSENCLLVTFTYLSKRSLFFIHNTSSDVSQRVYVRRIKEQGLQQGTKKVKEDTVQSLMSRMLSSGGYVSVAKNIVFVSLVNSANQPGKG